MTSILLLSFLKLVLTVRIEVKLSLFVCQIVRLIVRRKLMNPFTDLLLILIRELGRNAGMRKALF